TTMPIQTDINLWTTIFIITGLGISHLITGNDDATLQGNRRSALFTELVHFGSGPWCIMGCSQTELQVRRLTKNAFALCGVLYPRQLNHDTLVTLTLHQRLSLPQLVNAVAYRG